VTNFLRNWRTAESAKVYWSSSTFLPKFGFYMRSLDGTIEVCGWDNEGELLKTIKEMFEEETIPMDTKVNITSH
jgi:hypothetical protein